jgi:hypothetical protein
MEIKNKRNQTYNLLALYDDGRGQLKYQYPIQKKPQYLNSNYFGTRLLNEWGYSEAIRAKIIEYS